MIFTLGSRGQDPERSFGMSGQVPSLLLDTLEERGACSFRCCQRVSMNSAS